MSSDTRHTRYTSFRSNTLSTPPYSTPACGASWTRLFATRTPTADRGGNPTFTPAAYTRLTSPTWWTWLFVTSCRHGTSFGLSPPWTTTPVSPRWCRSHPRTAWPSPPATTTPDPPNPRTSHP